MTSIIHDYSHWQTAIDYQALKAGGCIALMLKATQGTSFVDNTFLRRAVEARLAGLLVGAYHFCDASAPAAQVDHFLSVAGQLDVLAIDVEPNDTEGDTVTVAQAATMASQIAMRKGRAPMCYIGRYGPDGAGTGLPNRVLARCPLWVPNYTTAPQPHLPPGWLTWTFWQWTDTPTDENHFNGSPADLEAFWHG